MFTFRKLDWKFGRVRNRSLAITASVINLQGPLASLCRRDAIGYGKSRAKPLSQTALLIASYRLAVRVLLCLILAPRQPSLAAGLRILQI